MPELTSFQYKAAARSGELASGHLQALSLTDAVSQLQDQGYVPIQVRAAAEAAPAPRSPRWQWKRHRIRTNDLTAFTQALATLLAAGIPLDRTLGALATTCGNPALREVVEDVQARVREGTGLANALAAHPRVFPQLYLSLVRAGEASGALESVLERLAGHLERAQEVRETITSAMIYPVVLVLVAVSAVLLLLAYVVPQFAQLFADVGEALPLSTRIVVASGELVRDYGVYLALAVAGGIGLFWTALKRPKWRRRLDALLLRAPLLGELLGRISTARFSATLATLLGNGVGLLEGLRIARAVVTNSVLDQRLVRVTERVQEGSRLADALEEQAAAPALAVQMIRVGEESGELEAMLQRVAGVYERELQVGLKRLLAVLEPVLILGLGLVVGGIVLSILVAILGVNELVG
jgi:general secretion pathway protein F